MEFLIQIKYTSLYKNLSNVKLIFNDYLDKDRITTDGMRRHCLLDSSIWFFSIKKCKFIIENSWIPYWNIYIKKLYEVKNDNLTLYNAIDNSNATRIEHFLIQIKYNIITDFELWLVENQQ